MQVQLNVVEPWELAQGAGHVIEGSGRSLGGREAFIRCRPGTSLGRTKVDRVLISPSQVGASLDQMSSGPITLNCAGFSDGIRRVDFVATGLILGH